MGELQKHQQLKLRCRLKGLLRSILKHFLPHKLFCMFWSFPEELFFHIVDWYYCSGMTLLCSILWIYSSSVNKHFFFHIEVLLIVISCHHLKFHLQPSAHFPVVWRVDGALLSILGHSSTVSSLTDSASGHDRPVHLCQILFFSWYPQADKNQIVIHCHHLKVMWDCHQLCHTSIRVPLWTLSCAFVALQMSSLGKYEEVELVE